MVLAVAAVGVDSWSNRAGAWSPRTRDLMRRLAGGDRDALAPLMERHSRRVYRIALAYLRNADDALDVVQETFVKAFQTRRSLERRARRSGPG